MKRLVCIVLLLMFLVGCGEKAVTSEIAEVKPQPVVADKTLSYGMWMSYYEMDTLLRYPHTFKEDFATVLQNLKSLKITDLYLHVRSHCDSIFKSDYFPLRESVENYGYDVFEYMIEECHKADIKVHAWLNPYRVSTGTDFETLPKNNLATKWLNDGDEENDKNVLTLGGIYLNPAEETVRTLILNGIKEILTNYDVDGIHFDDYFYPTTDPELDAVSYENYKNSVEIPLSLQDWRRTNVDILVSSCKTLIDTEKTDVIFSISPAASIERNYNEFYADIGGWIQNGYLDAVLPQLYFGFKHTDSNFCFENLLSQWKNLSQTNNDVNLEIGLAAYKIGTESVTDGDEWMTDNDVIARQTEICLNDPEVDGVIYFSYSSLFSGQAQSEIQKENLLRIIE